MLGRTSAMIATCVLAAGCATPGTYDWGRYDELLYRSYKDVTRTEELRIGLENHIAAMEAGGRKVAPGLYAELGTLYLQAGDSDTAIALYAKERAAWPESKGLMDAMIVSLERRRPAETAMEVQP